MNNQAEETSKTAEDRLEELLTLPICEKCYPEVVSALGYLGQKHKKSIGAEQILSVFVEAMELADECAEARFPELKIPQAIIKLKKDHNIEEATIYRYSLKCNVGCVIALLFLIILGAKLKTPTLATERVFVNAISSIYKCLTDDVKNHSALWPMVRKLIPVPPKPKEAKEAATKTPQPAQPQAPAEDLAPIALDPHDKVRLELVTQLLEEAGADLDKYGAKAEAARLANYITDIPLQTCKNYMSHRDLNTTEHNEEVLKTNTSLKKLGIDWQL